MQVKGERIRSFQSLQEWPQIGRKDRQSAKGPVNVKPQILVAANVCQLLQDLPFDVHRALFEGADDPDDWTALSSLGHRMVDDMLTYLRTVRDRPVWQPLRPKPKGISRPMSYPTR